MMPSYDFTNPNDLAACLRAFLAEHPTLHTARQAVAQATGVGDLWLSTEGMVQFFDWAREKNYISSTDAQWAITKMRELADAHHNQRQRTAE